MADEIRDYLRAAQQAELRGEHSAAADFLWKAANLYRNAGKSSRALAMLRHAHRLDASRREIEQEIRRLEWLPEQSARRAIDDGSLEDEMKRILAPLDEAAASAPTSMADAPDLGGAGELPGDATRRLFERGPALADPELDAWCSFCCKPKSEVGTLVAGPAGAFVCAGCVSEARRLLGESGVEEPRAGADAEVVTPQPAVGRSAESFRALLTEAKRAVAEGRSLGSSGFRADSERNDSAAEAGATFGTLTGSARGAIRDESSPEDRAGTDPRPRIADRGGDVDRAGAADRGGAVDRAGAADRGGAVARAGGADRGGGADREGAADRAGGADRAGAADRGGAVDRAGAADRGGGADRAGAADRGGGADREGAADRAGTVEHAGTADRADAAEAGATPLSLAEIPQQAVARRELAQALEWGRRRILLLGPVGAGKSTALEELKRSHRGFLFSASSAPRSVPEDWLLLVDEAETLDTSAWQRLSALLERHRGPAVIACVGEPVRTEAWLLTEDVRVPLPSTEALVEATGQSLPAHVAQSIDGLVFVEPADEPSLRALADHVLTQRGFAPEFVREAAERIAQAAGRSARRAHEVIALAHRIPPGAWRFESAAVTTRPRRKGRRKADGG